MSENRLSQWAAALAGACLALVAAIVACLALGTSRQAAAPRQDVPLPHDAVVSPAARIARQAEAPTRDIVPSQPEPPAEPEDPLVAQIKSQRDALLVAGRWEEGKIGRIGDKVFLLKIIDGNSFLGAMADHHVVFNDVDTSSMTERAFVDFGKDVFISTGIATYSPDEFRDLTAHSFLLLDSERARQYVFNGR